MMLPYLRDRPLSLVRYPEGITGERIFQKNVGRHFPDWIPRAEVDKAGGELCQVLGEKPADLVYLANQACIELHALLSRTGSLHQPDQLIFDLDPPGDDRFGDVRTGGAAAARHPGRRPGADLVREDTGSRGLHVLVLLNGQADFDSVREFARQVAVVLAAAEPELVTVEQRKDARGDRIYADIMRNGYAQTAVAPYSVRARPGAPVAVPLHWDEVADPGLTAGRGYYPDYRRPAGPAGQLGRPVGRDGPAPVRAGPATPPAARAVVGSVPAVARAERARYSG